MSATQTKESVDPRVPITHRLGGRLPNLAEADLVYEDVNAIQHVEMNLRALHDQAEHGTVTEVTGEQLAALLLIAEDVENDARNRLAWAESIRGSAWALFHQWRDEPGLRRAS